MGRLRAVCGDALRLPRHDDDDQRGAARLRRRQRLPRAGEAGRRIDLRFEDYRDLRGRFDKIVSIEMFEAVGFAALRRVLRGVRSPARRDGVMLLQTITVDDWRFAEYRSEPNWISKYIFPGAELASVGEILASLARSTPPVAVPRGADRDALRANAARVARALHRRLDEVRAQGFDDRFIRMWDLYLGYCEAAFLDRHIGGRAAAARQGRRIVACCSASRGWVRL